MDSFEQVSKFLPTSWCSMDVAAGQNPWKLDRLGPVACFRLKVLWVTNHLEPFYITEGPMVAKLWRLDKMTSDGMLLERASKHADPSWQKLVVRPNEAAIMITVVTHQAYYTLPIAIQLPFHEWQACVGGCQACWLHMVRPGLPALQVEQQLVECFFRGQGGPQLVKPADQPSSA